MITKANRNNEQNMGKYDPYKTKMGQAKDRRTTTKSILMSISEPHAMLSTKYRTPISASHHSTRIRSTRSSSHSSSKTATLVLAFSVLIELASARSAIRSMPVRASLSLSLSSLSPSSVPDIGELDTQLPPLRQKLSIETNSIQRHEAEANSNPTEHSHGRSLKRALFSNKTISCNDGSQAGFYLRKNPNSKKWIVFLEGGWHCFDKRSCRTRWLRQRHLMTSAQWPETRDVGGILSPLPEENPYWHSANHVLVPYCSSDSWSGTRVTPESQDNNWRFMGALILREVIDELIPLGLGRAGGAELLLVGSSAGGLGVMLNLDRITRYLQHERNLMVTVRGVSDSGWFIDREPYTPAAVAASEAVRQGWKLWQGLLPDDCVQKHADEPWRCYFGYRLYPTLKSPLFVFQWLFDEAQMRADNVGAPVTPQQWNYIHEMGGALRSSLDNVTAVFAPSCIGHAVLSKRDWVNIKIDDISLPVALRCWEHSTRPRRKRHDKLKRATEATLLPNGRRQHQNRQRHQNKHRDEINIENKVGNGSNNDDSKGRGSHPKRNRIRLTKAEREERKRRRHERQQRRRENRNRRNRKKQTSTDPVASVENGNNLPNTHPENGERSHKNRHHNKNNNNNSHNNNNNGNGNGKRRRKEQHSKRRHESIETKHDQESIERQFQKEQQPSPVVDDTVPGNHSDNNNNNNNNNNKNSHGNGNNKKRRSRVPRVPEKCALRLLERCSWPQCNHSCPTLTNPLTGEEMRFLELLTSFGLDIEAVAAALGVDMHTLNNMDRTELVNLLTQQVS